MFVLSINGTLFQFEDIQISKAKELHSLTEVKFIHKGKILDDTKMLSDYFEPGIKNTIMMVKITEAESKRQEELADRQKRASKNYQRALATRPTHNEISMGYCKHIELLPQFSDSAAARDLLAKIRDDVGIKLIMKNREWRVTRLIELHPDEKTILGYNQNKGQIIALRLRNDSLDSFRSYSSIIKVMLHELAHMVFSEHDEYFHGLDRELNKEYALYYKKQVLGEHYKGSGNNFVEGLVGDTQRLGGRELVGDRREIILNAVESRLSKEEIEMESACALHKH